MVISKSQTRIGRMLKTVLYELRSHAPFTLFGTLTGMIILWNWFGFLATVNKISPRGARAAEHVGIAFPHDHGVGYRS